MKTTPITGTLTQLTRLRFVNAYLVKEDDGFTLVDTTVARSGAALLAAATQAGAPIRRIALTHGHGDHVGSLDELKAELVVRPSSSLHRVGSLLVVSKSLPTSSARMEVGDGCYQADRGVSRGSAGVGADRARGEF